MIDSGQSLQVIILAAGRGTRMRSSLPKVLHQIGHLSLLQHVVHTVQLLKPAQIFVVYGEQGELLQTQCADLPIQWIHQPTPQGTAHAVLCALPQLAKTSSRVLILYGDVPGISAQTLQQLYTQTPLTGLGLITAITAHPQGLGRIVRNPLQQVQRIVEEKDATITERQIQEINSGIYLTTTTHLQRWLPQIRADNSQQEFYITDIVKLAVENNIPLTTVTVSDFQEIAGINDREQLAQAERYYQQKQAKILMQQGVTLRDPERIAIRGEINIAPDVTIDMNVILEGKIEIGKNCKIGPNCLLRHVKLGERVHIEANCVLENAVIEDNCIIGPFARIRPGTYVKNGVKIGNFVEIKNSHIGTQSKIPHLSYVGDAVVGNNVNIGAGVITCNYNGREKQQTHIGDGAFIGSDAQLIAPVEIGEGAYIGAGSTITKNAPAGKLTVARARQTTLPHWQRPEKPKQKEKP